MKVDTLDDLETAFAAWRDQKKHPREAMPDELIARAQRATKEHGVKEVVRVTRVERGRLFRRELGRRTVGAATRGASTPGFTRFEMEGPRARGPDPIAEVETAAGVRLRVFEGTPELMGLLSAICGPGDTR